MHKKKYGRLGSIKNEKDKIQKYMDELLSLEVSGDVEEEEDLSIISELISFSRDKSHIEDNKDSIISPINNKEYTESEDYLDSYKEAARLDRENYVSFFGTDEEKENLRLEKEAIANDLKRKADERILKAEKEEKALKLAEELEIKTRVEQLLKEKERIKENALGEFIKVDSAVSKLTKNLMSEVDRVNTITAKTNNIWTEEEKLAIEKLNAYNLEITKLISENKKPKDVFDLESIENHLRKSMVIKDNLEDNLENNLGFLYRISLLETSKYPLQIASNLYTSFNGMLKFMFDTAENEIIYDENFRIDLISDICHFKNKKIVYSISMIRQSKDKLNLFIECRQKESNSSNINCSVELNSSDYTKQLLPAAMEDLVFQVISRQWHNFKNEDDVEVYGIKELFLEQIKKYQVKETIDAFTI